MKSEVGKSPGLAPLGFATMIVEFIGTQFVQIVNVNLSQLHKNIL